jgi:hypothetical protein
VQLTKILTKSLHDYKSNPVLFIPSLLGTAGSFLASAYSLSFLRSATGEVGISRLLALEGSIFGSLFISLVVGLLVLLGQVSMTGRVILTGKTGLGDWWVGLRKYFWKVVVIGAVFWGVVMGITFIVTLILVFTVLLPAVLTNPGSFSPNQPNPLTQSPFLLSVTSLSALGILIFYMMLAPAILDNKGAGLSIISGMSAVRRSGRVFLVFLGLVMLVTLVTLVIGYPNLSTTNLTYNLNAANYFTLPRVFSGLLGALFTPLWMLIAFRIYSESGVTQMIGTQALLSVADTKVCQNCTGRIPSSAKYCTNCGTNQS